MPRGEAKTKKRPTAAERKRREEQATAAKAEPNGEAIESANGVMLIRTDNGQGNIDISVGTLGDVKMTEVPTILAIAQKKVNEQMGIG